MEPKDVDRRSTILLASDGQLRSNNRVLARIEKGEEGSFARVIVEEAKYEVIRGKRSGWGFVLVRLLNRDVMCEFSPFHIRRGGRLRWGSSAIGLRSDIFRPRRWYFTVEGRRSVSVDVGAVRGGTRAGTENIEMRLCVEQTIQMVPEILSIIAFGCWLIVQWEATSMTMSSGPPILLENL